MSDPLLAPPPRGEWLDLRGRRLHLVRAGPPRTPPLVLLEAGSFGSSADWGVVQALLADRGVGSIAYDRAGLGHSDPGPAPRDSEAISVDLETLLAAVGEAGPLVYVGHSMAGLHARVFARRNAEKIAGLVLVDAVTVAMAEMSSGRSVAAAFVQLSRAAAWAAKAGWLRRLQAFGDSIGLPPDVASHKRWAFAHPGHNRNAADEVLEWDAAVRQARTAGAFDPAWPVAVVTAGTMRERRRIMNEPALASRAGLSIEVGKANHASLLGRRHAAAIVTAIEHVRGASRT